MALTEKQQKEWERGAPYSSAFTQDIVRQLRQAIERGRILWDALDQEWQDWFATDQDASRYLGKAEAAEALLDEAVRLLGQAEEANGWTTPNEFLRRAAKVLAPAEAQARQKAGSDARH